MLVGAGLSAICSPPVLRLKVDYAECGEFLRAGPVCVVAEARPLKLWVEPLPGTRALDLLADGRRLRGLSKLDGLFELEVPPGAKRIGLRAEAPPGFAVWSLAVAAPEPRPAWFQEARDAPPARKRQILNREISHVSSPELRRAALDVLARSMDGADREALLREGITDHRAAGRLWGEVRDATYLAFWQIESNRFGEARRSLDDIRLPPSVPVEVNLAVAHNRDLLARRMGDFRLALQLQQSLELAERLDLQKEVLTFSQALAITFQTLGRWREAEALYASLDRRRLQGRLPDLPPCDQAQLLTNEGWMQLMAREVGARAGDPSAALQRAKELLDSPGCDEGEKLNARINLALAYLDQKDLVRARATLAETAVSAAGATLDQRLWLLEIQGRLEQLAGRGRAALVQYDRMERLAASSASPDGLWRSAYGRARALETLGDVPAALAAYREAERQVDGQSLAIAVAEGRETFMEMRQAGTRDYLNLLLRSAPAGETFAAVRRARARLLRQLERADPSALLAPAARKQWEESLADYQRKKGELERATTTEWQLPASERRRAYETKAALERQLRETLDRAFAVRDHTCDELAPPGPEEVILAYEPLGEERWVGFAADAGGVEVAAFALPQGALPPPPELARLLLSPFRMALGKARRVRVLASGRLEQVDFHALPWDGDVLLASRRVTYSLDLPCRAAAPAGDSRRALIVADPLGNLTAARREAREVASELQAAAWQVDSLTGRRASLSAVSAALSQQDLLHYAGHATVLGATGWESELPLADGTPLTIRDLLAAPRVPSWVVLAGCETGRTTADTPVATLGLAHAFLLAGARGVVATARPVSDRTAARLSAELYRGLGGPVDLAALLRRAQLALRHDDPTADWQSFRVYEP